MKLDEIKATFRREFHKGDEPEEALTAGLRAVLRECIEPMIVEAHFQGQIAGEEVIGNGPAQEYAHRIITAIVEK